jgi:hypothetical protein
VGRIHRFVDISGHRHLFRYSHHELQRRAAITQLFPRTSPTRIILPILANIFLFAGAWGYGSSLRKLWPQARYFDLPANPPGLTLVFETEDQRVYRVY